MKSKITLLIIFLFSLTCFSQDKTYDLLKNKTQTNILYDRVFALSNATKLNLKKISTNDFLQVYHEIQRADFNERLPKLETLKKSSEPEFAMALKENPTPVNPYIFIRGNAGNAGKQVPRQFLAILSSKDRKPFSQGSGRLELAQAIANKEIGRAHV